MKLNNNIKKTALLLGSSQLSGCQGDFCKFDFNSLSEHSNLTNGTSLSTSSLNSLRKLVANNNENNNEKKKRKKDEHMYQDYKRSLQLSGILNDSTDTIQSNKKTKNDNLLDIYDQQLNNNINDKKLNNNNNNNENLLKISFRSIAQARQEAKLVQAQLDRHIHGDETTLYFTEDQYKDLPLSSTFPSHFYQQVPCCSTCFQVYYIIDKARARAISIINKNRKDKDRISNKFKEKEITENNNDSFIDFNNMTNYQKEMYLNSSLNSSNLENSLLDTSSSTVTDYDNDNSFINNKNSSVLANISTPLSSSLSPSFSSSLPLSSSSPSLSPSLDYSITPQMLKKMNINNIFSPDYKLNGPSNPSILALLNNLKSEFSKVDIAEIRSLNNPHPAIEVTLMLAMLLLVGQPLKFKESIRLINSGVILNMINNDENNEDDEQNKKIKLNSNDNFLYSMKKLNVESIQMPKLLQIITHLSEKSSLITPINVGRVNLSAGRLCAWVIKKVCEAAEFKYRKYLENTVRIKRGNDIVTLNYNQDDGFPLSNSISSLNSKNIDKREEERNFVQNLEQNNNILNNSKKNRSKTSSGTRLSSISPYYTQDTNDSLTLLKPSTSSGMSKGFGNSSSPSLSPTLGSSSLLNKTTNSLSMNNIKQLLKNPTYKQNDVDKDKEKEKKSLHNREQKTLKAIQNKTSQRLSLQTSIEGSLGTFGTSKLFICSDKVTTLPYMILGKPMIKEEFNGEEKINKINFIVIHDFFDTFDSTGILFKPVVKHHDDKVQVLTFNYPGQAHTTWPRLTQKEKESGLKEPIFTNEWLADRIHELLSSTEKEGDFLLTRPFHLVGIGNGSNIAVAFLQKYLYHPLYRESLRSFVSINGFLHLDGQLSSILHSSETLFESTPQNRPDIPVSYWSRYLFSEDYLQKVSPNLALNILSAVSNPITNLGRSKLVRGALHHKDMRGALNPLQIDNSHQSNFLPIPIPIILLQSTENNLVTAGQVDPFLIGRISHHFWSHLINIPNEKLIETKGKDITFPQFVGKLHNDRNDYHLFSSLGKNGLEMLMNCLNNSRGAFVLWVKSGHAVQQENKTVLLDLLDALVSPSPEELLGSEANQNNSQLLMGEMIENFGEKIEDRDLEKLRKDKPIILSLSNLKNEDFNRTSNTIDTNEDEVLFNSPFKVKQDVVDNSYENENSDAVDDNSALIKDDQVDTSSKTYLSLDDQINSLLSKAVEKIERKKSLIESSDDDGDDDENEAYIEEESPPISSPYSTSKNKRSKSAPSITPPQIHKKQLKKIKDDIYNIIDEKNSSTNASNYPSSIIPGSTTVILPQDINPPSNTSNQNQRNNKRWIEADSDEDDEIENEKKNNLKINSLLPPSTSTSNPIDAAIELENELRQKQAEYLLLEAKLRELKNNKQPNKAIEKEESKIKKITEDISEIQSKEDMLFKQARIDHLNLQKKLEKDGIIPPTDYYNSKANIKQFEIESENNNEENEIPLQPIMEMPPVNYYPPISDVNLPTVDLSIEAQLEQLQNDEREMKKLEKMKRNAPNSNSLPQTLTMEEYNLLKNKIIEKQLNRDKQLRVLTNQELYHLHFVSATLINKIVRGFLGRRRAQKLSLLRDLEREQTERIIKIQSRVRGWLGRALFKKVKTQRIYELTRLFAIISFQRIFRGYLARKRVRYLRVVRASLRIQRVFRGYIGRCVSHRERARLKLLQLKHFAASKIQSIWRAKCAMEEFRSLRIHTLAAVEIQRVYRGHLHRKKMLRRRLWESTKPGPERIKLGLQFVSESEAAYKRQQEEIEALHRAQEVAESRIARVRAELSESETELVSLERELQEIDHIERDLQVLTHDRMILQQQIDGLGTASADAAGMPRTASKNMPTSVLFGQESTTKLDPVNPNNIGQGNNSIVMVNNVPHVVNSTDPIASRRQLTAQAHALELTLNLKRQQREQKRRALELEFAQLHQKIQQKQQAFNKLQLSLQELETTRVRKQREFARLQKNLMQLLVEQKQELDDLREKGIALETATATTAAAAVATATKAKQHEENSKKMFSQAEELMKFQFMSMSLSYFSSLNMLKSLRDMNADTTSAAVALAAEASSTAAASANAANLPIVMKNIGGVSQGLAGAQINMGGQTFVDVTNRKKEHEVKQAIEAQKDFANQQNMAHNLPSNVAHWTLDDVSVWLDTISLGQYKESFMEASIDGPFLLELREEDLVEVLHIKHKLHVRKLLVMRERLKPLSQEEKEKLKIVQRERDADYRRIGINSEVDNFDEEGTGVPFLETVFSQARNNRIKRVEESLNMGFQIDSEDEKGNTLLIIAAQNRNKKLVEMLVARGARINHQNTAGNSALHYAMQLDTEGIIAEYLISQGADDTLENLQGLTPYDGY